MNMRTKPPHRPMVSPQVAAKLLTPTVRMLIEQAIEGLLQLLDDLDGDADLEPSLGAPEVGLPDFTRYLGRTFEGTTQEHWSDGRGDLEEEEQHDAEYDPAEAGYVGGEA